MDPTGFILSLVICHTTMQLHAARHCFRKPQTKPFEQHQHKTSVNKPVNIGSTQTLRVQRSSVYIDNTQGDVSMPLWRIIWQLSSPATFGGISQELSPLSDLRSSLFSQWKKKNTRGQGLPPLVCIHLPPPLNTLDLTVSRRLLPAPRAVRSLRAVLAVQGRS